MQLLCALGIVCLSTCVILKEVEQRKKMEREDVQRVQERSEVQLREERPTKEHAAVSKEELPGPLKPNQEPYTVAEESTGEPLLGQDATAEIVAKEVSGSCSIVT